MVEGYAERLAGQQAAQAGDLGALAVEMGKMGRGAKCRHRRFMLIILRIVDQTAEMHLVVPGKMTQDLQRPDLLPLDRRIRNPLGEEQQARQDKYLVAMPRQLPAGRKGCQ